ncbi:hypothetical protein NVP1101O_014 [Vibrio phage 1.101.O._10N.261.45.C6]|nr:hypothetical protein NVP1101O_014 [Vibrio phage 1.101.O._10N.261.45.C6]
MDYWEAQELALYAMGYDEETVDDIINNNEEQVEELLYEKFDISLEQFQGIAELLLNLTPTVVSPMSERVYHAFVKQVPNGFVAITQKPA